MKSVRINNAYLLFYDRKTQVDVVKEEEKEAEKNQKDSSATTNDVTMSADK